MAKQEMLLDSATSRAAVAGEKWAMEKGIEHYAPMIDELAVDEDMKQHLIMKRFIAPESLDYTGVEPIWTYKVDTTKTYLGVIQWKLKKAK